MKFKLRYLLPVALACFTLSSCDWIQIGDNDTDQTTEGYYKGYNLSLTGARLEKELQKQCFDKHTTWIGYNQVNSYFSRKTDADGNVTRNSAEAVSDGNAKNQWFYTGKESSGTGTREHVWPCAKSGGLWIHNSSGVHYVDGNDYIGGGSDLYHIRTCNSTVNTARGDSYFLDFDVKENIRYTGNGSDIKEVGESGGKYKIKLAGMNESGQYADYAEPADEMKGDIARILLYIYIHYAERGDTPEKTVKYGSTTFNYSDFTGGLALTNIIGYTTKEACQNLLKSWNEVDPVSEVEKLRNDTVQKIQGNRNPFVDHPELVNQLF